MKKKKRQPQADSIDELNKKYQVEKIEKVLGDESRGRVKGAKTGQKSLSLLRKIKLGDGAEVEKALGDYQADPNVLYVEPNYLVQVALTPNDPYYNSTGSWGQAYDDLWGLKKINTSAAWDIETGASNEVVVAVIDTGIDYLHPDLAGNTWVNSDEIPDNNIDDDNNGYVDDYYGYDFFNEDGDPTPTPTPTPVPTPTPTLISAPSYAEATEGKVTPAKMGDVNLDSKVDIFDLSILLSKWGR